ncbi:hypothetical protein V6N13_074001 [Hibiscus sabdariffa]
MLYYHLPVPTSAWHWQWQLSKLVRLHPYGRQDHQFANPRKTKCLTQTLSPQFNPVLMHWCRFPTARTSYHYIGGNSWLTAVKKAFVSPTKENQKRSSRGREDNEHEEQEKKRGKRRWIFKKPSHHETVIHHSEARTITTTSTDKEATIPEGGEAEQRHAIAVVIATTTADQVVRFTRPSDFVTRHFSAIVIQTAFRGHLVTKYLFHAVTTHQVNIFHIWDDHYCA